MRTVIGAVLVACAALSACASGYTLVAPGTVSVLDLEVDAGAGWNRVPGEQVPWARPGTEVWTRNGLSLDRLVLIPQIENGDSIYRTDTGIDYPLFRVGMRDDELVDLVDRTIELAQGVNLTEVTTTGLRSERFGDNAGLLFDLSAVVHDGPVYRGTAGAFVSAGRLYLVYFLGASPHFYEQQSLSVLQTIRSARR